MNKQECVDFLWNISKSTRCKHCYGVLSDGSVHKMFMTHSRFNSEIAPTSGYVEFDILNVKDDPKLVNSVSLDLSRFDLDDFIYIDFFFTDEDLVDGGIKPIINKEKTGTIRLESDSTSSFYVYGKFFYSGTISLVDIGIPMLVVDDVTVLSSDTISVTVTTPVVASKVITNTAKLQENVTNKISDDTILISVS